MPFFKTNLEGLMIFEPVVYEDSRGYFFESYNANLFSGEQLQLRFVQDNQSGSAYGVIRGLHYQLNPFAQSKLVRVLAGRILDVVVDIRQRSPTYGQKFSIELSAENKKQLFVPPGFAHGFSVLSDRAEVLYKCDQFYSREHETGIRFNDRELAIDWKIPAGKEIVSEKDQQLPLFGNVVTNF